MKIDKSKSPDRNRPWRDYGFDETKIDLTAGGKSDQLTLCPECSANRGRCSRRAREQRGNIIVLPPKKNSSRSGSFRESAKAMRHAKNIEQ